MKYKIVRFSDIAKHPNLSLSLKDYIKDDEDKQVKIDDDDKE